MELFLRFLLKGYRKVLHRLYKLDRRAVMPRGELCSVSHFKFLENHGDIVHPCVRYSAGGFRGYHWWMVYTPYYDANADIENPILCFGVGDVNVGPSVWEPFCEIIGKPPSGYNSDPTMFFDEDSLFIYWRENFTPRTSKDNLSRATYGCVLSEKQKIDIDTPILCEKAEYEDKQVSPVILKRCDTYVAYAMHLTFLNPQFRSSYAIVQRLIRSCLGIASTLGIYSDQKSHGISVWKSDSPNEKFKYSKTIAVENCNPLYRPWHLDCFEHNEKLYAVIQTTQCNADICLAVSQDWETFVMYSTPLLTNASSGKVGLYKPCGFVHRDIFYLYYTAQDESDRSLNSLYIASLPMSQLLAEVQ